MIVTPIRTAFATARARSEIFIPLQELRESAICCHSGLIVPEGTRCCLSTMQAGKRVRQANRQQALETAADSEQAPYISPLVSASAFRCEAGMIPDNPLLCKRDQDPTQWVFRGVSQEPAPEFPLADGWRELPTAHGGCGARIHVFVWGVSHAYDTTHI